MRLTKHVLHKYKQILNVVEMFGINLICKQFLSLFVIFPNSIQCTQTPYWPKNLFKLTSIILIHYLLVILQTVRQIYVFTYTSLPDFTGCRRFNLCYTVYHLSIMHERFVSLSDISWNYFPYIVIIVDIYLSLWICTLLTTTNNFYILYINFYLLLTYSCYRLWSLNRIKIFA